MSATIARAWLTALPIVTACGDDDSADTTATTDATTDATTTDATTTDAGPMQPTEGPWADFEARYCPPDSLLTLENFGGPFLLDHCMSCHHSALPADMRQDAPLGVDFDQLAAVRAQAPRIWARAADQNATMPPLGPPAADQRALLGEWLACGAPQDSDLP
ncbi:MAG: hypothetical protein IPK80_14450 [Nannocystis sp.]|nr:hypothetical protein [Nannocystis sp.]